MYPDSWIYRGFTSCILDLWWKQNDGQDNDLRKTTWLQVDFLSTDGFNSEILPCGFVMQRQILINVNISLPTCLICPYTYKGPITAHNALENGTWFRLMTDAQYIALSLTSRNHYLDPTNRDISRVHCNSLFSPYSSGFFHRHWGNHKIAPVPVKQPWRIWVHKSMHCGLIYDHSTAKHKKLCISSGLPHWHWGNHMIVSEATLKYVYG